MIDVLARLLDAVQEDLQETDPPQWTDDDRLRQPRFLELRRDKDPCDVIQETPNAR